MNETFRAPLGIIFLFGAVVVLALFVAAPAYAATTVGANISTDGTLTIGGAVAASSTLQVTGAARLYSTLTVDSTLAIATTSPGSLLSIQGVGNFAGTGSTFYSILSLPSFAATSTTATSTFSTGGLTVGTSQFLVQQTSGRVGIGTTTPGSLLSIHGSAPVLTLGDSQSSGAEWRIRNGSVSAGVLDLYDASGSGNSRLTISTAGSLGVGTTSPATLFTIHGSAPIITLGDSQASGGQWRIRNGSVTAGTLDLFDASGSGNSRFAINSSGNVGIGTTTPGGLLGVGNGLSSGGFYINATSGNVGIGTTTPSFPLSSVGDAIQSSIATTTLKVTSTSATQVGCIEMQDASTRAVYRVYIKAGAVVAEAGSCE